MPDDPFQFERFIAAQADVYPQALAEITKGKKQSHWMWFIFPQLEGLGRSETARFFAIKNAAEAAAFLAHPVLGPRVTECANAMLAVQGKTAREILGFPDDLKLLSSMTLFASISSANPVFLQVIRCYFDGQPDPKTLQLLSANI